jgi:hypothetical protein
MLQVLSVWVIAAAVAKFNTKARHGHAELPLSLGLATRGRATSGGHILLFILLFFFLLLLFLLLLFLPLCRLSSVDCHLRSAT